MSTNGFTCNASSEYSPNHACGKTYDSNVGSEWATRNEGAGAWIEIKFPAYAQLSKIETKHRFGGRFSGENFKDIILSFSNNTTQSVCLKDGTDPEWNVIEINPSVKTKSLKISAMSAHERYGFNPGFSEIKFYTCPGMSRKYPKSNLAWFYAF